MEITYTVTRDDLLAYNMYYQRVSGMGRRTYWRTTLAVVIMGVAATLVMALATPDRGILIAVAVGVVIVLAIMPFLWPRALRRAIKRQLNSPRVEGAFGEYRAQFSREGLHATSPIGQSQVKWNKVWEIARDGEHVYVCLPGTNALIIPRDSYRGPVSFEMLPAEFDRLRKSV